MKVICMNLHFGAALETITHRNAMRLPHWNPNTRIKVQQPDSGSANTAPYLYVVSDKGRVPWIPTYLEMFATNWEIVEDENG